MTAPRSGMTWQEASQNDIARHLRRLRAILERYILQRQESPNALPASSPSAASPEDISEAEERPTALDRLCQLFRLTPFERDVVLLCAGTELDSSFATLCGNAQGDPQRAAPTFSLALAALPEAHWSAVSPDGPLRRYRLIEIGSGTALTASPLRIDERILHCLVGVNHLDERLRGIVEVVLPDEPLVPSHQAHADRIAALWEQRIPPLPVIQLCGQGRSAKRRIAGAACRRLGLSLGLISADTLPTNYTEWDTLIRLWEREALLTGSALLLDAEELDSSDIARASAVARTVERTGGFVLLATRDRQPMRLRSIVTLDITKPTRNEQETLWQQALGASAKGLTGHIQQTAVQFDMDDLEIRAVSATTLVRAKGRAEPEDVAEALWESCRVSAQPRLDDLAQRIEPMAGWDSLVLPDTQQAILRAIAAHVQQRGRVYYEWEFAGQGKRGLGSSALFAGASGTGKTMAAEVLARELNLDLYRIDLSAVVSKYIGESEKNLRRVFDAAEAGGVILLFDEADALFGKRSEVKDSHDRYANQEVAYLLQRMEAYRGLAVLTTNLKSSLDIAFLRRLRYVVQFPFPDAVQRAEIWRRVFPAAAPTEALMPEKLARLTVAGGNIRNIALNAAFFAAGAGEPIRMSHILRAAQSEYAKLEKTLTEAEITGWV